MDAQAGGGHVAGDGRGVSGDKREGDEAGQRGIGRGAAAV